MGNLHELSKELANQIEKQLPDGMKFILLLAKKDSGKCATNIKGGLLPVYLRKCADSLSVPGVEIEFIEITIKK